MVAATAMVIAMVTDPVIEKKIKMKIIKKLMQL